MDFYNQLLSISVDHWNNTKNKNKNSWVISHCSTILKIGMDNIWLYTEGIALGWFDIIFERGAKKRVKVYGRRICELSHAYRELGQHQGIGLIFYIYWNLTTKGINIPFLSKASFSLIIYTQHLMHDARVYTNGYMMQYSTLHTCGISNLWSWGIMEHGNR